VAEEIALNHITTGAGNDIERATELARKMVCEWGMGKMGPVSFGKKEEHIFLGREMSENRNFSEKTAVEIDEEIKELVHHAYIDAKQLITKHQQELKDLADALLERESINGSEIDQIIGLDKKEDESLSSKSDD
jgi:cell division protease FtsH